LRDRGIDDFVLLERSGQLGGTWHANRYPGAASDVQSRLYEFAFAPNPGWNRRFAGHAEIRAYLERCADEFGVRPHIRFDHEVLRAAWDDATSRWDISTSQGRLTSDVLVAATGALSEPFVPDLPGLASFSGPVVHTAEWLEDLDVTGRRVAIVDTGAAIQVIPAIQPRVDALTIFQRHPPGSCRGSTRRCPPERLR
jgi:cation diffusion facilitator CzcD-associated flavoprotein CzcO